MTPWRWAVIRDREDGYIGGKWMGGSGGPRMGAGADSTSVGAGIGVAGPGIVTPLHF